MKKSFFSKFFLLSIFILTLLFNNNFLFSQVDGCECKFTICNCCGEERTYQLYEIDGTPEGTPITTNNEGCAPNTGAFGPYPCGNSYYLQEINISCDFTLPKVYFTMCICGNSEEMEIKVPCCTPLDNNRNSKNKSGLPTEFKLNQNFPNPFNPVTKINFELPENAFVKLTIYDVTGKIVDIPLNANITAGYHEVIWNANKQNLSSGVYFYKLEAGSFTAEKKMILMK